MQTYIGSGHGSQLGVRVVSGRDLDDVSGDDVQAVQTTQDRPQLARGPPACLGRPGRRGERGVDGVNLEAHTVFSVTSTSGVPEACPRTSMDRYTGMSPTVSRIFLMMPAVPAGRV